MIVRLKPSPPISAEEERARIVAWLREIIWSVTGCSDKLAIDAAEQAADLIERLSCPAGDVVEAAAKIADDLAAILDAKPKHDGPDYSNSAAWQLVIDACRDIADGIRALAASQPQASRDSVLEEAAAYVEAQAKQAQNTYELPVFSCIGLMGIAAQIRALKSTPPPISAEEERARIVAWLRAADIPGEKPNGEWFADQIERGDHNQPELPGDVGGEA